MGMGLKKKGDNIEESGLLDLLQGELRISNLGQVANANEVVEAKLKNKKNLQSLILSFRTSEGGRNDRDEVILEGLVPHTNLEELKLLYYRGTKFPDWISSLTNLVKLHLEGFYMQLPALGQLPFLEDLVLLGLGKSGVDGIGEQFYGISGYGGGEKDSVQQIVFPKLKKLKISYLTGWKKWYLPYHNGNKIDFFPNLIELNIAHCNRLQALPPGIGKLRSLESLKLSCMQGLKSLLCKKYLGRLINDGKGSNVEEDGNGEFLEPPIVTTAVILFPALMSLELFEIDNLEEHTIPELKVDSTSTTSITIMPCLSKLRFNYCSNLECIPLCKFSHGLKISCYPNLNYFEIVHSSQSSLPQGFNQLTSIRNLRFSQCKFLRFGPDDLKHLHMLERLRISDCPILAKSFEGVDISSSTSHVYKISISPAPINVHTDIWCVNCKMYPIVGKRYKCKDCYDGVVSTRGNGFDLCGKCYNTPSKHTDLVKRHRREGHAFELIANRGDNPVPVHPKDPSEDADGGLLLTKSAEIEEQNNT